MLDPLCRAEFVEHSYFPFLPIKPRCQFACSNSKSPPKLVTLRDRVGTPGLAASWFANARAMPIEPQDLPAVLTVAGSDSGGGAGIQADLKTFAACGVYGTSAITALTAQNTEGVFGVEPVSAAFVGKQIETVLVDISIRAIKTGMLPSEEVNLSVLVTHHLVR